MKRTAAILSAFLISNVAKSEEAPKTAQASCQTPQATNGAIDGESIQSRLARLETALRLTKAEIMVNAPRRKR